MQIQQYLEKMQNIQQNILEIIDSEEHSDKPLPKLTFFDGLSDEEKPAIIKETLHMISHISNFHRCLNTPNDKIYQILLFYKTEIKATFSDREVFNIFRDNKKILLFLFKENIIKIDNSMCNILSKNKEFFSPEINSFYGKQNNDDEEFERKRQRGENDSFICHLIRDDLIDDFIVFVNEKNFPLTCQINRSSFETNLFLIQNNPTLIEYSAFYGSIRIFKYLLLNNVQITPSVFLYAVHGRNTEIISLLEESNLESKKSIFQQCFIESIRCFHNELTYHFEEIMHLPLNYFSYIIPFYNFSYFNEKDDFLSQINLFVENNYVFIVKKILDSSQEFDINKHFKYERVDYLERKNLLTIAVEHENIEIVKYLINNKNASVYDNLVLMNTYTNWCYTSKSILYLAVEKENKEIVDILVQERSKIEPKFLIDMSTDNFKRFDYISDDENRYLNDPDYKRIFVDERKSALSVAVENGDVEIVELLLKDKQTNVNDVNSKSYHLYLSESDNFDYYLDQSSALSIAVEKENKEIVQLLLNTDNINVNIPFEKIDVDVNKYQESDFCHVYYCPDKCNFNDYTKRFTALSLAEENGNQEIYQLLQKKKKSK